MNRTDEAALVWALVDSVAAILPREARARLCMKIGAGEQRDAIMDLLTFYERSNAELSVELAGALETWIRGYQGTDAEPILRDLFDRITSDGIAINRSEPVPAIADRCDTSPFPHSQVRENPPLPQDGNSVFPKSRSSTNSMRY